METKTLIKIGGKTYGLRPRAEGEEGVNCRELCPISERCKGVRADAAYCALMKVMSGVELKDFAKYIVYEVTEKV